MSDEYSPTPAMEEGGEEGRRHQEMAQEVEARQAAERAEETQTGAQEEADVASASESGQPATSVGPAQRPSELESLQEEASQEEASQEE